MVRGFLFLLLAAGSLARAQQPSLLATDFFSCFTQTQGNLTVTQVVVDHPQFSRALHIRTNGTSANPWDTRVRCFDTLAAHRNDTILVTFWMRTTASPAGWGSTEFVLEKGADPWTKSGDTIVTAQADWKKMQIPFSMLEDYGNGSFAGGANTYNLSFWVNFPGQEIEIGGFSILNYLSTSFWDLGLDNWPYDGYAPDAPWRAAAAERIEEIRKADIAVVVRDEQGNPVGNAPVKVKMKRHAFGFGTAVAGARLLDQSADGGEYRAHILKMFNKVVLENDLKWPDWEGSRQTALSALEWLRSNGITDIRGHNLIWPGRAYLPRDVQNMLLAVPVNQAALRTRINEHFRDEMTATLGKLTEWDVLNEPYTNRDVQAVLGDREMAEWFKLARQLDPAVKLFVNDYNILEAGGTDLPHQDGFYNIAKFIMDNGGPVDGLGLQSHFGLNLTPPELVWEILDRFAQLGKPLEVTEFDINILDERLQAAYTRDFLTAIFSHRAVSGFLMWGFWEGAHWAPNASLIHLNWSTKPNYDAWMDLTQTQWWTNAEGTTGADGVFRTRGFLGDYDIDVNGQTLPLTVARGQVNYLPVGRQTAGTFTAEGVVNAASFQRGPVAPGEIIEIWGSGFGPQELALGTYVEGQLVTAGGDTKVYFDGVAAPFIHALTDRAAVVAPYSLSGSTNVEVEYLGTKSAAVTLPVAPAAPGIFCWNDGTPLAVAVSYNLDGSVSLNRQVAVDRGGYLEFYITGEGQTAPAGIDGKLPVYPNNPRPALPIEVKIGGVKCEDPYNWAGQIYSGVLQINARVPEDVQTGEVALEVKVGDASAQAGVTVRVR
jgi:endo-1,4-beta-xylanase